MAESGRGTSLGRIGFYVLIAFFCCLLGGGFLFYSCAGWSSNTRARASGMTMNPKINPGEKLIDCDWKDADGSLWYLVELAVPEGQPRKYEYRQKTVSGLMQGRVAIEEERGK